MDSSKIPDLPKVIGVNINRLKQHSGWTRTLGIAFVIIGLLAIAVPGIFSLGFEMFLGWLFLFGGIFQIITSFRTNGTKGWLLGLVTGILACVVGVLFVMQPFQGVRILTIILAAYYLFDGISKIIFRFTNPEIPGNKWGWVNGIFGIIIAGLVWIEWPLSSAWFIGLLVGVNMLFYGIALISLASACRRHLDS